MSKSFSTRISGAFDGNTLAQGAATAIVGGTTSRLTGGKFANGAVTAAMAFAFNQMQSFLDSARALREEQRLIRSIDRLSEEDFRTLFPSYNSHRDVAIAKLQLHEDWRVEVLSGRLLETARLGSIAVQEESMSNALGATGWAGKGIVAAGRAAGLSDRQIRILSDIHNVRSLLGSDVATTRRLTALADEVRAQRVPGHD